MSKIKSNTFAAACFDMNTVEDLRDTLATRSTMKDDMAAWALTEEEWVEQIKLAIAGLEAKAADE